MFQVEPSMDWEEISRPFERKPMVTQLVSIDLVKGQLRAYAATPGSRPKLQQVVDLVQYQVRPALPNCDFEFDAAAIEDFRLNPHQFVAEHGNPEAA
jgi:hypothetical protein